MLKEVDCERQCLALGRASSDHLSRPSPPRRIHSHGRQRAFPSPWSCNPTKNPQCRARQMRCFFPPFKSRRVSSPEGTGGASDTARFHTRLRADGSGRTEFHWRGPFDRRRRGSIDFSRRPQAGRRHRKRHGGTRGLGWFPTSIFSLPQAAPRGSNSSRPPEPFIATQNGLAARVPPVSQTAPAMFDGSGVNEFVLVRGQAKTPGRRGSAGVFWKRSPGPISRRSSVEAAAWNCAPNRRSFESSHRPRHRESHLASPLRSRHCADGR